jgi:hypothetical protein
MKTLLFLAAALLATPASAACYKSYVCNDYGRGCGYRDVCTSTLDLPSTNLPPLPRIAPLQLKPLPSMTLPPLGTTRCQQMLVNGTWQNICQ